MKRKARFVIATMLLLGIFVIIYLVFFNTFYFHKSIKINSIGDNNSALNSKSNVDSYLLRKNDKLYYNYGNNFFKNGTYEISENISN